MFSSFSANAASNVFINSTNWGKRLKRHIDQVARQQAILCCLYSYAHPVVWWRMKLDDFWDVVASVPQRMLHPQLLLYRNSLLFPALTLSMETCDHLLLMILWKEHKHPLWTPWAQNHTTATQFRLSFSVLGWNFIWTFLLVSFRTLKLLKPHLCHFRNTWASQKNVHSFLHCQKPLWLLLTAGLFVTSMTLLTGWLLHVCSHCSHFQIK